MTQGWNPFAGASKVAPQGQSGIKIIHSAGVGQTASSDVKIERCTLQPSMAQNGSGLMYIVEYEILESTSHEDPPGAPRSWNQKRANEQQGLAAVRAFINGVLGITHDQAEQTRLGELVDQVMLFSTSPDNPFRGYYVHVDNLIKPTQRQPRFNLHQFTPFDYAKCNAAVPNFDAIFQAAQRYQGQPPVAQQQWGGQPPAGAYGQPQPPGQQWGAPPGQPGYGMQPQQGQAPQQAPQGQGFAPPGGPPPQGSPYGGWRR